MPERFRPVPQSDRGIDRGFETMRTWDRLSASFVRGLNRPGRFYDGGGLMLTASPTKVKGVVTKAWLYRYQIDQRERFMGLGSARVVYTGDDRRGTRGRTQPVACNA